MEEGELWLVCRDSWVTKKMKIFLAEELVRMENNVFEKKKKNASKDFFSPTVFAY